VGAVKDRASILGWSLKKKRAPASAFALAKAEEVLDVPMGWGMAAYSYIPPGRIRDEIADAHQEAANGLQEYKAAVAQMHFFDCLPLNRALVKTEENIIQDYWDGDVRRWWPDAADGKSRNARPEKLPFPLLIAESCKVGYIRMAEVGGQKFGLAVGELKNSDLVPLDGAPQAIIAAVSAAAHMRRQGLAVQHCVVPFFMSNGQLEQHGCVYLLEPCVPCAILTTPVLDMSDAEGQRRVSIARWACKRIAENSHGLLVKLMTAPPEEEAAAEPDASIDLRKYLFKEAFPFVGPSAEHSVLHQMHVFEKLLRHPVAQLYIVPPVAAMMQYLVPDESTVRWEKESSIVFSRLKGFNTGVPRVGEDHREAVLLALKTALQSVHAAGVVHMDLYPGNIMWRALEGGGAAGGVELRLVDFDAALFIGQPVPDVAAKILERNGHTHTYHPRAFVDFGDQPQLMEAAVDFDWWHYALLQWRDKKDEDACPFVIVCSPDIEMAKRAKEQLKKWRADESAVTAVLSMVQDLVTEERRNLGLEGGAAVQAVEGSLGRLRM
jgi:Lipopolysaccharide kinase (Kdo/WaaP) family